MSNGFITGQVLAVEWRGSEMLGACTESAKKWGSSRLALRPSATFFAAFELAIRL